jgi:hypothetical protein
MELTGQRERIYSRVGGFMDKQRVSGTVRDYRVFRLVLVIGATALALASVVNRPVSAQDQTGAGIVISAQATAKELGLPIYPGAKPHKDEKEDSPATQLGLWGGSFGFKLVVLKMESSDSPEKIAAYYQKALAKYGTVLNCTDPSKSTTDKNKSTSPKQLDCGDDKPDAGGMLFKAGTKEKQHIVGINPKGQVTVFQLLYIEARGTDGEKKAL